MTDEKNVYLGRAMAQIGAERRKAVDNGNDVNHDYEHHNPAELLRIAACYMDTAACQMADVDCPMPPEEWPETDIPWVNEPTPLLNAVRGAQFAAAAIDLIYALTATGEYEPPVRVTLDDLPIPPEDEENE